MTTMSSVSHKGKLIELVKLNPGLWRQSRKARGFKQKLWDDVGAALGTSGFDAKRQWEILRDQLRRETKRYKQNPHYKSTWTFYSQMQFSLQPSNDPVQFSGSADDTAEHFYPDRDFKMEIHHHDNNYYHTPETEEEGGPAAVAIQVRNDLHESNNSLNIEQSVNEYSQSPRPRPVVVETTASSVGYNHPSTSNTGGVSSSTQKRRRLTQIKDDGNFSETTTRTSQIQNYRYPSCEVDDEDYYFAMSLVPSLRCIPRSKKLRVRSKILDLIAVTLEGEFDEDSNYGMSLLREDDIEHQDVKTEPIFIPKELLKTSIQPTEPE